MLKLKSLLLSALLLIGLNTIAQDENERLVGANCTSIMVGKKASTDGSVITSHTCDGRYRTWMRWEPAADHEKGEMHKVYKGTMHTEDPFDNRNVELAGEIPKWHIPSLTSTRPTPASTRNNWPSARPPFRVPTP